MEYKVSVFLVYKLLCKNAGKHQKSSKPDQNKKVYKDLSFWEKLEQPGIFFAIKSFVITRNYKTKNEERLPKLDKALSFEEFVREVEIPVKYTIACYGENGNKITSIQDYDLKPDIIAKLNEKQNNKKQDP